MSYSPHRLRSTRRHLFVLALAVGTVSAACGGGGESSSSTTVDPVANPVDLATPEEFGAFVEANPDVPLVNVHIPYEDHIVGTDAFIPFDSILESDDLPTDMSAPIALYCRSGTMSAQAADDLADAGYTNIIDLEGGMNAWEAGGNDLLNDPSAVEI